MPTVTPVPSTPKSARAFAASSWVSPSETTLPEGQVAREIGVRSSATPRTRASSPIRERGGRRRHGHHLVAAADVDDLGAGPAQGVHRGGGAALEADVDEDSVAAAQEAAWAARGQAQPLRLSGRRQRADGGRRQLRQARRKGAGRRLSGGGSGNGKRSEQRRDERGPAGAKQAGDGAEIHLERGIDTAGDY